MSPPVKVVMTYKLRDESDVIEDNIRYHVAQGITTFLATDNGSTDGTRETLARYEEKGLMTVFDAPTEDFRLESRHWLTRMARYAASELDADWVIHNDADEFWWPLEGTIPEVLAGIPTEFGAVISPRSEFLARPEDGDHFSRRMTVREARARLRPKVAHRAEPDVVVLHRGAHDVAPAGEGGEIGVRSPGRPVLRGAREDDDSDGNDERLVWAPTHPLRTFHFPLRDYAQFERKVRTTVLHGAFADRGNRKVVREHLEGGTLPDYYESTLKTDAEVRAGLESGEFVEDRRFADFLEGCPDPLAGDPGRIAESVVRPHPDPDALTKERAELELESLRVMSRTQRLLIGRLLNARETVRALEAELDRAKREKRKAKRLARKRGKRLERFRQSPLVRARQKAGRLLGRGRRPGPGAS
jgi:hypothetical protein